MSNFYNKVQIDNGEGSVDKDNPLPIEQVLTFESDVVTQLREISRKLSALIKYEAMLHKIDLEEDI